MLLVALGPLRDRKGRECLLGPQAWCGAARGWRVFLEDSPGA